MRLSHQVLLATTSKTIKHISVFILSIILARSLSTGDYGIYLQVQLIVSTLLYLAIFGVPHSIYFFLPRSSQPKRLIGVSALVLNALGLALALLVFLNIDRIAALLNNPGLVPLVTIAALLLFFQVPIKLFEPAMIAAKRVGTFVALNATFNFLFIFPIAIPALLGWPVEDILASMLFFYVVQYGAVTLALIVVTATLKGQPDGETYSFRAQLVYSVPIGMSGMVGEVGRQADKLIVGSYFDPAHYAIYTRGAMEIPLLNVISNSLHNIMMPTFVEAYRDGNTMALLSSWQSAIRMMAAFVYPAAAFFIGTGDLLIPFLYSDRFAEASIIFQIYMFGLLVRITTGDAIIRAIGKTAILFKMSLAAISFNIVLTIILVDTLGILGAPLATVLTAYSMTAVYTVIVGRMLDLSPLQIYPWRSLGRILVVSLIAITIATGLRVLEYGNGTKLGLIAVVFALVYLSVFRRAEILSVREKNAVQSVLPRQLRWIVA
jgi:O-antigen/teichoic acid export membrane protein